MKFEPRTADDSVNVTPRHPLADAATLALEDVLARIDANIEDIYMATR